MAPRTLQRLGVATIASAEKCIRRMPVETAPPVAPSARHVGGDTL